MNTLWVKATLISVFSLSLSFFRARTHTHRHTHTLTHPHTHSLQQRWLNPLICAAAINLHNLLCACVLVSVCPGLGFLSLQGTHTRTLIIHVFPGHPFIQLKRGGFSVDLVRIERPLSGVREQWDGLHDPRGSRHHIALTAVCHCCTVRSGA